jgi:hypothetical protein
MATQEITDLQVLLAYIAAADARPSQEPAEVLATGTGQSPAICREACERAAVRGLVELVPRVTPAGRSIIASASREELQATALEFVARPILRKLIEPIVTALAGGGGLFAGEACAVAGTGGGFMAGSSSGVTLAWDGRELGPARPLMCAACGKPIPGAMRYADGIKAWHSECRPQNP